jgi:iron complex transport system substrate-binding protein
MRTYWLRIVTLGAMFLIGGAVFAKPDPEPATDRMVSLAPHLTELAFIAGAGDRIIGTVDYSDYPNAARRIPRVGDAFRVDYERLLALSPQLVLAWDTGTPESTIARIRELGMRVELFSTQRVADVARELRRIGDLTDTSASAELAATRFETEMAELERQYRGRDSIRVFVQINEQPLYTVNGAQIISEVVELCGGVNVFAALNALAPAVGEEAVIAADPEVILSVDETVTEPITRWQRWKHVRAVRAKNVFRGPADNLARPTTRLVEGTRAVCELLDVARENRSGLLAK